MSKTNKFKCTELRMSGNVKVKYAKNYIDEQWVVDQYLMMEKNKSWSDLDNVDDMNVLNLEREMLAQSLGVTTESLPPIQDLESL